MSKRPRLWIAVLAMLPALGLTLALQQGSARPANVDASVTVNGNVLVHTDGECQPGRHGISCAY